MKAPGAVPGRVGKCPRCGSLLKVPDDSPPGAPPPPAGPIVVTAAPGPPAFHKPRTSRPRGSVPREKSDGLVPPPKVAESRFVDSISYPLWNASGIALLIFMPPLLWFATSPMIALLSSLGTDNPVTLLGLVLLVPPMLLMLAVGGYILLFLGQVLVSSALGEVLLPRSPGWDLTEIGQGLGRWFWALIVGGAVGGLPATVYWIWCGPIDLLDRIVLLDLILPGMAYAQMALLATLIHESPLAANPVTVTRAILRLGWSYCAACAESGVFLIVLVGWFAGMLRIQHVLIQSLACWAFWLVALYAALVTLRRLGLYCYRNAIILEWFPDRTRRAR